MENLLSESAIVPQLGMYIAEINEAQIDREGRRIGKSDKGDTEIGLLVSDLARRLWCASRIIKAKETELTGKAHAATDDEAEKRLKNEAHQLSAMAEICRDMAFYEMRESLGYWDGGIGIRDGWMVVKPADNNEPPEIIKRIFGM